MDMPPQPKVAKSDVPEAALPTRREQPTILIRGFGGLGVEDEKRIAYQGFNDGTVYPQKRGENYIYEGLVLRFMKSRWGYQDSTNVIGYYGSQIQTAPAALPAELKDFDPGFFSRHKIVIDPEMAGALIRSNPQPGKTLWVFRYYDLDDRKFATYGEALVRLIDFIRALTKKEGGGTPKVNIIAHSMGGLIVREAVQRTLPAMKRMPAEYINKIVTLGTPHRGISFQLLKDWIPVAAQEELETFNPEHQADPENKAAYVNFANHFPLERLLTVVGTNYRSYGPAAASWMNRLFSAKGEFGPNYNRSDGLVKQTFAQIPGAPRTFVHKCHGGFDSLVTSREAFEVATRFFFGDIHVRLHLVKAQVTRGFDLIGKSEIFFGVSIKPRGVDFELFHQSAEAENCYGPFHQPDFSDGPDDVAFGWAGKDRMIWEGWLDTTARTLGSDQPPARAKDIVMRLDVYVGERDLFGLGFSDNVIFRKQYYVRSTQDGGKLRLELYTGEEFREGSAGKAMRPVSDGWEFDISGTGFEATMRIAFAVVPETGLEREFPSSDATQHV
jgi:pimeloyl-ACP methyl ester carboxylesterase